VKIQGIKRGKTIELLEYIDVPDGAEITLEVDTTQLVSEEERLRKLNTLFGTWENHPDLDEAFAEIDRERHDYHGRNIDFFDI
jgi:antitoxin component of MazEF toxin-antitoxin module